MMIIHPPLKLCLKMQGFPPYKWDVSGQWHLRLTKILHNLAPVCLQNLLHTKNLKYYFRYRNILDVPQVRTTTYGKRSFRFAAASLWNSLPDHFRTENSFAHFRSLVQSWLPLLCLQIKSLIYFSCLNMFLLTAFVWIITCFFLYINILDLLIISNAMSFFGVR